MQVTESIPHLHTMDMDTHFNTITFSTTKAAEGSACGSSSSSDITMKSFHQCELSEQDEKPVPPVANQRASTAAEALAVLKRPLSAYNVYFQLERKRILNGDPERMYTTQDVVVLCDEQRITRSQPKSKRLHRKTHGSITFQQMARTIADSWKVLDKGQNQLFQDCAGWEKKRYLKEKKILKMKVAAEAAAVRLGPPSGGKIPVGVTSDSTPVMEKNNVLARHEDTFFPAQIKPNYSGSMLNNFYDNAFDDVNYGDNEDDNGDDVLYQTHQNLLYNLKIVKKQQERLQQMEQSMKLRIQQQRRMIRNNRRKSFGNSWMSTSKPDAHMMSTGSNLNPLASFSLMQMIEDNFTERSCNFLCNTELPSSVNFASRFFDIDTNENIDYLLETGAMDDENNTIYSLDDDIFNQAENALHHM